MADQTDDKELRDRIESIVRSFQVASDGRAVIDVQAAVANFVSGICYQTKDPDGAFLQMQSILIDIYATQRQLRAEKQAQLSPRDVS